MDDSKKTRPSNSFSDEQIVVVYLVRLKKFVISTGHQEPISLLGPSPLNALADIIY